MPEHIQVGDVTPRIQYTANGALTTFFFSFPIFEDADIEVYSDSVLKTPNTDYTVHGAGASGGGSVTFRTPPPDGTVITLRRNIAIRRTSDFQQSGVLRARVLNDELDRMTATAQQLADFDRRTVSRPSTSVETYSLAWPDGATTDEKAMMVTSTGLSLGPTSSQISSAQAHATNATNSAAAAAASAISAQTAQTAAAASAAEAAAAVGFKVSSNDSTAGDLEAKLLASGLAGLSTQNDGGAETRTIDVPVASRAEAEAGSDNATAMTPERVAQAIAAIGGSDQVARDLAIAAYIKADIAAKDPAGVYGDIVSDNFTSDTLPTRTNATYDAAADHYHNGGGYTGLTSNIALAGQSISGGDRSTTYSESQVRAYDGSTSTRSVWRSLQSGSAANEAAFLGQDFGAGNEKNIRRAYFNQGYSFNGNHGASNVGLDYSDDGSNWTRAASASGLTQRQSWATLDSNYTGEHRYWRIVVISGLSNTWRIQELQLKEGTYNPTTDMTLRSSVTTLPKANPLDLSMYFRVRDIDTVEGDDRVIKASIDGGATWATATITDVGAYGGSDKLIRADADVSAQTGDRFVWELVTSNAKEQQVKQVASVPGY